MDGGRRRAAVDRWLIVLWLLAAVVCVGCTVTLSLALYHAPPGSPVQIMSVRGLENRLALKFPPGTELVEAKYRGSLIQVLEARVRMPREEVEPWLCGPPFIGEPSRASEPIQWISNQCEMTDWHPGAARSSLTQVGSSRPGDTGVQILADLDHPRTADVYVYWNMQ